MGENLSGVKEGYIVVGIKCIIKCIALVNGTKLLYITFLAMAKCIMSLTCFRNRCRRFSYKNSTAFKTVSSYLPQPKTSAKICRQSTSVYQILIRYAQSVIIRYSKGTASTIL